MWVRKSKEQLREERRRIWRYWQGPVGIGVFAFLGMICSTLRGPNYGASWPRVEFFTVAFGAAVFAAFLATLGYVLQLIDGQKSDLDLSHETRNVEICFHVRNQQLDKACECGGSFEPFEHWSWVDAVDTTV